MGYEVALKFLILLRIEWFFFKISTNPSSFSSNNIFFVFARKLVNFFVFRKNSTSEKINYLWVERKMLNIIGATKNFKMKPLDSAFQFFLLIWSWKNWSRRRQSCYQNLKMLQKSQLMWGNKKLHESLSATSNEALQSFTACWTWLFAPVAAIFGDHEDRLRYFHRYFSSTVGFIYLF